MNGPDEQRVASNENLFRRVNEAIRSGRWPTEHGRAAFRCECAHLGCNELLDIPVEEYERIRGHGRWFVVAPGHEEPAVESVVERAAGYFVVEKRGVAGRVADEADPRRGHPDAPTE